MDDTERRFQAAQLREALPAELARPLFRFAEGTKAFDQALLEILQDTSGYVSERAKRITQLREQLDQLRDNLESIETQVLILAKRGSVVETKYNELHEVATTACARISEAFEQGKEASWGPVKCPEVPPLPPRLEVPSRDDLLNEEVRAASPEDVRSRPHISLTESAREARRAPTAAEIGWEVLHLIARTRQIAGESADEDDDD